MKTKSKSFSSFGFSMAESDQSPKEPKLNSEGYFGQKVIIEKAPNGIQFKEVQITVIDKVIERFNKYDGVILKAYMGAGKTWMSMAIMSAIRLQAE